MMAYAEMIQTSILSVLLALLCSAAIYMGLLLIYFVRNTVINHRLSQKIPPLESVLEMKMGNPNEKLMLTFGFMVVVMWVLIAAVASYFSIVDEREITDSQLTVIGLLGGPALLIITSVLDLFKGKESAKISILPDQLDGQVQQAKAIEEHTRALESMRLQHDLDMEKMQKAHELNMEAFSVTGTNSVATGPTTPKSSQVPATKKPKKTE
tara:strand:- start:179 stop:808 length:630 start_codon:yes stop_codon:yes gene_type:complete